MSHTADVTSGKPIADCSQSISGENAINPLVAFNDRKREELFFYIVTDTKRDIWENTKHLGKHETFGRP
jgi:two-component SAPR family response regulator